MTLAIVIAIMGSLIIYLMFIIMVRNDKIDSLQEEIKYLYHKINRLETKKQVKERKSTRSINKAQ